MKSVRTVAYREVEKVMTTATRLVTALLLIPIVIPQAGTKQEPQPLTVCQIMERLADYDSHIVAIRGTLLSLATGVPFFTQLAPTSPETCLSPGTSLPARIDIYEPDMHFLENPPAGYQLDRSSVKGANAKMNQTVRQNPNTSGFLVVIQGYLVVAQQGPATPPNIDRHGWYPAKLIIQSYKSLEVIP